MHIGGAWLYNACMLYGLPAKWITSYMHTCKLHTGKLTWCQLQSRCWSCHIPLNVLHVNPAGIRHDIQTVLHEKPYSLQKNNPSFVQVSCLSSCEAGEVMCSSFIYSISFDVKSSELMFVLLLKCLKLTCKKYASNSPV